MNQRYIITVCRGNIGRSPFAEAIINQELARRGLTHSIKVASRGVQGTAVDPQPVSFPNMTYYPDMYKDSKPTLDKFNVDMSQHISKPITSGDVEQADLLLAADNKTKAALLELFPNYVSKIYLLSEIIDQSHDIVDPEKVNGSARQEQVFSGIHHIITTGFPRLLEILNQSNSSR